MPGPDVSLYIVQSNALPGREDEFNDWYTRRHLPEMLTVPGFASAQRFVASPIRRSPATPPYRYSCLAIYEVTGDPRLAFAALARARAAGAVTRSPAISGDLTAYLFEPVTTRLVAPAVPGLPAAVAAAETSGDSRCFTDPPLVGGGGLPAVPGEGSGERPGVVETHGD